MVSGGVKSGSRFFLDNPAERGVKTRLSIGLNRLTAVYPSLAGPLAGRWSLSTGLVISGSRAGRSSKDKPDDWLNKNNNDSKTMHDSQEAQV